MSNPNLDYDELLSQLEQLTADMRRRKEGPAGIITPSEAPDGGGPGRGASAEPGRDRGTEPL